VKKKDSDHQFQAQIRQNSKTWGLKKKNSYEDKS